MNKEKLHPIQQSILDLLKNNFDDPLTFREMQDSLGVSSTSVIAHHIQQLEKKGFLKRNPSNPKDYQILSDSPEKSISYINLYGLAQCGPNGSILDGDPVDRIPISSRLLSFPVGDAFMVRAKGNSMTPKINDGDLVVAKKVQNVDNGEIAVCVNDGQALIKKINKNGKNIILTSINTKYEPFVASKNFKVEGVVKNIYSYEI